MASIDLSQPVAIVGAGPVGLSLALGLSRQGVRSILIERKAGTSEHSKAPVVHVRTREALRRWAVEERFLEAGVLRTTVVLHSPAAGRRPLFSLDFSDLDDEADRPGVLVLEQGQTERLLLEAVRGTGLCDVRFGAEAVGLSQGAHGVTVRFRDAGGVRSVDAQYVAGCDGASSFVRGVLGLSFEGITYSSRPMLADVEVDDDRDTLPWPRTHNGRDGITSAIRLRPGLWRIIRLETGDPTAGEEVPAPEVDRRVGEVLGMGPVRIVWASRFRIHRRSSPRFRKGRVLLAGDAAHIHSPAGGLGMNGGIQDAENLAWKLAAALRGGDVDRLLDSYDVERRAVMVGSVSRYADLLTRVFLQAPSPMRAAALVVQRGLTTIPQIRRRVLRRGAMLDLSYPPSPLLDRRARSAGVRLPNLRLRSPGGATVRLHDLLPAGPAILEVADDRPRSGPQARGTPKIDAVVRVGPGGYADDTNSLRRLLGGRGGRVLVRPDGCVAWARRHADGIDEGLSHALGVDPAVVWSGRARTPSATAGAGR